MFKDFNSKFTILCEEDISRFRQGGFLAGDYVKILPSVLKHPKLAGRGSQFFDQIREMVANKLPTKISTIKSERAESSNGLIGSPDAPTGHWADVVQCASPALFVNVITLPIDVLEVITPEGNGFSPDLPDEWKYDNKVQIKAVPVKLSKDAELQLQTQGTKRWLPTEHTPGIGPEAKDGRDGLKKPVEYKKKTKKESLDMSEQELLVEAYQSMTK